MSKLLQDADRARALAPLLKSGWAETDGGRAITRTFTFHDFVEAFGWMTRVALAAEKAGHHPDWSNSFRTVTVTLSTHSAGGLTGLDIDLATTMNRLAGPGGGDA